MRLCSVEWRLAVVVVEKQAGGVGLMVGREEANGETGAMGAVGCVDGGVRVMRRDIFSAAESMYCVYACAIRRTTFGRRDIVAEKREREREESSSAEQNRCQQKSGVVLLSSAGSG